MRDIQLVGSSGSTRADVEATYALIAAEDLNPLITTVPFEEIGTGLDRLRAGHVSGRLVAVRD
ncbi:hypothetical protein BH09ACT12_BH09ACT12_12910 [soil metagenome]